ncbi:MAG: 2Fe-2S iron-sulfur cluster-binding protein [Stagnimonas sp.]|nr:2Fe-2S iron-sulfur cluster-binding protein [Stagnimonas sp.]
MARLQFLLPSGEIKVVEALDGQTLMEAATGAQVPGIVGECGGGCSCATCHLYVDQPWFGQLPAPDEMESGMLEGAVEPGPLSRLSCQIRVSDALDGVRLRIPAGQL